MKYKKMFYAICFVCFAITCGLITAIVCDLTGVYPISVGLLFFVCFMLLSMIAVDLCCIFVLQTFYEDWKWRHLKKNEKWKR